MTCSPASVFRVFRRQMPPSITHALSGLSLRKASHNCTIRPSAKRLSTLAETCAPQHGRVRDRRAPPDEQPRNHDSRERCLPNHLPAQCRSPHYAVPEAGRAAAHRNPRVKRRSFIVFGVCSSIRRRKKRKRFNSAPQNFRRPGQYPVGGIVVRADGGGQHRKRAGRQKRSGRV